MTLNTFLNSNLTTKKENVSITIVSNGITLDQWEDISVDRSLNSLSASFSVSLIDKWRQRRLAYFLKPGVQIALKIGADPILIGYIDTLDVSITNSDRQISISGRDLTGDLVDSSAESTPSEFKNITVESLSRSLLKPYQLALVVETPATKPFEKFSVKEGESVFEVLERAAKARGLLLLSRFDGSLVLKRPDYKNTESLSTLTQGVNVTSASASYTSTERFSNYTVKSQTNATGAGKKKQATEITATAEDAGVSRYRPKTIIAESSLDADGCRQRVQWEASVRAARSIDANVSVQGWRTSSGELWDIGKVVNVDIGFIGVQSKKMLISTVSYSKTLGGGTTSTLGLTRVDAFESSETIAESIELDLGWDQSTFKNLGL